MRAERDSGDAVAMASNSSHSFEWARQNVLVTGAGGFIGSHLVERLLRRAASVRAFVHYNSRNDPGFVGQVRDSKLTIMSGDIRDLETVRSAAEKVDIIFHLAALVGVPYSCQHVREVWEVNTIGTLNVLTAGREHGVRHVIQTSTSEVYGTARTVPIDENHPKQPQSPYAASKIAADSIALSFYRSFGLPVTICRPFNTYGPRQSDRAVIPALMVQALEKDEIAVGNLSPTRDFTFVSDTVEGFIRLAECDACQGEEINLGTGSEISIADLTEKIAGLAGRRLRIARSEERVRRAGEVERLCSDNSKARVLAGWSPVISLDEGLRLTMEWMRKSRHLFDPDHYRI